MKKYYAPINPISSEERGFTYYCDHPLFNEATLFLTPSGKGLLVIQQKFNKKLKYTWWGRIDDRINIDISNSDGLDEYLEENAKYSKDALYPFVEVRKLMWALRLPSMKKMQWETRF